VIGLSTEGSFRVRNDAVATVTASPSLNTAAAPLAGGRSAAGAGDDIGVGSVVGPETQRDTLRMSTMRISATPHPPSELAWLLEGACPLPLAELRDEYESPVPGKPIVCRVPLGPKLMDAPGPPIDVLSPDLLTFRRMPGNILIDLRKRNPTRSPHCY
jgi:hypothetical protein